MDGEAFGEAEGEGDGEGEGTGEGDGEAAAGEGVATGWEFVEVSVAADAFCDRWPNP